jgi:hypothetical protein
MKRLNSKRMVCRPDMTHAGVLPRSAGQQNTETPRLNQYFIRNASRDLALLLPSLS